VIKRNCFPNSRIYRRTVRSVLSPGVFRVRVRVSHERTFSLHELIRRIYAPAIRNDRAINKQRRPSFETRSCRVRNTETAHAKHAAERTNRGNNKKTFAFFHRRNLRADTIDQMTSPKCWVYKKRFGAPENVFAAVRYFQVRVSLACLQYITRTRDSLNLNTPTLPVKRPAETFTSKIYTPVVWIRKLFDKYVVDAFSQFFRNRIKLQADDEASLFSEMSGLYI